MGWTADDNDIKQFSPTPAGSSGAAIAANFVTISALISSLAPLASPALTGTPTAPTPASDDNSTALATTAFVVTALGTYLPLSGGTVTGELDINAGTGVASRIAGLVQEGSGTDITSTLISIGQSTYHVITASSGQNAGLLLNNDDPTEVATVDLRCGGNLAAGFSMQLVNSGSTWQLYDVVVGGPVLSFDQGQGAMKLPALGSAPTPVAGGMYFDGAHIYGCVDGATWNAIL